MKNGKLKILIDLYITFCKIGVMTFGGGLAMMPMMKRELIDKRRWMTEEELIDYYAVGQTTPGIIAVNVSTFIGSKKAGIPGGIIGTLGIITPSVIIITILAGFINSIDDFPWVQRALKGINVAVAALLTNVTVGFAGKTVTDVRSFVIAFLSFAAVYFFHVPSFCIIIAAAAVGIILYFISNARDRKNGGVK